MNKAKNIISLSLILVLMIGLSVVSYAAIDTVWTDSETGIEFNIKVNEDGTTSVTIKSDINQSQANLSLVQAMQRAQKEALRLAQNQQDQVEQEGTSSGNTGDNNTEGDTSTGTESDKTESGEIKEGAGGRTEQTNTGTPTTITPDNYLSGSRLNGVTVQNIWGGTVCLDLGTPISQGSAVQTDGTRKDIAYFSNGNMIMPLDPVKNYSFQVDKLYTGSNVTTETISKYTKSGTRILGETSETAKAAYLFRYYDKHETWQSDMQAAMWTTSLATSNRERTNPLEREAAEYEKFVKAYEDQTKDGGNIIKDTVINKTVSTDTNKKEQWLGKYEIDYVRGAYWEEGIEKVEFGGIIDAVLYDQDGKEISKDAWEFVPVTVKEGKERTEVPEWDRDYKFPYPEEKFYIKLNAEKLDGVNKITKIKYTYQRLDVRAEVDLLEGTYDTITWKGKKTFDMCWGAKYTTRRDPLTGTITRTLQKAGECGCMTEKAHQYNIKYFVAEADRDANTSQPLATARNVIVSTPTTILEIPTTTPYRLYVPDDWHFWPYWPDYPDEPERPDADLTFTIAGVVWEDTKTGKESNFDGLIGVRNSQEPESGIKNVEVRLYEYNTSNVIRSTYTDANGAYVFNEVPVGTYDVGFTYDGMTYTTTQAFAGGSESDYKQNPNDDKYQLNSKAEEDPRVRQDFNDKFEVIHENGSNAYGLDADRGLYYDQSTRGKSILQTTYEDGKVREPYKLETKTSYTLKVGYPFTGYVNGATSSKVIAGQTYQAGYTYMAYINLGLKKREPVDFALTKDVSSTTLTVNGKQMDYVYNARNENAFDIQVRDSENYYNREYNRALYSTDYTYRIDAYDNKLGNITGAAVRGLKSEDQELKVFVTYKVKILNQSVKYSGTINELVDYFDKDYNLVTEDVKLDIRKDDGTWIRDKIVAEAPYYSIDGKTIAGDLKVAEKADCEYDGFKEVRVSGIEDKILQSGEYIYVYLTFEVDKDKATRNIKQDTTDNGKNNYVEISSYSTYDAGAVVKTNTVGMIDRDSAPGTLNPLNENTIEDDSDKAPPIKIYKAAPASREISGYVWEDERDQRKIEDGVYSTGNGKREGSEHLVNGVVVQLVEIITDVNGNKVGEYIWQEMLSGGTSYKYMDISGQIIDVDYGTEANGTLSREDGKYIFTNFVPGDYIVRFKYGTDERTIDPKRNTSGKSYNGQDFKSTVYLLGDNVDREWYDLNDDVLRGNPLSAAKDIESNRIDVMNYSKVMTFEKAEVLESPYASRYSNGDDLWATLAANTQMTAETAKIRIEVEKAKTTESGEKEKPWDTYQIQNLNFGLVERPKADLELNKEIVGIKITLADGSVLIDTEAGIKRNVNWVSNRITNGKFVRGAIHLYMDEEVMQGANIQIKYKITVTNNSEVDYTGRYDNSVGDAYYTGRPGSNDRMVRTTVDFIADYVDTTLVYRADDNTTASWKSLEQAGLPSIDEMSGKYLDSTIIESVKRNTSEILVTDSANKAMTPDSAPQEVILVLSKTISSNEDTDPTFDNVAEIIQYTNDVGRRSEIPGNQDPGENPTAGYNDSDRTETITITPPTGENRAHYYILATAVLAIMVTGVVLIKKKVLDK